MWCLVVLRVDRRSITDCLTHVCRQSEYEPSRMVVHSVVGQVEVSLDEYSGRGRGKGRSRRRGRRRKFGVCPKVLASAGHGLHRVARVAASLAPQLREVGWRVW